MNRWAVGGGRRGCEIEKSLWEEEVGSGGVEIAKSATGDERFEPLRRNNGL